MKTFLLLFFKTKSSGYEFSWNHNGSYNNMYVHVIFLKHLCCGRCLINVFVVDGGVADLRV